MSTHPSASQDGTPTPTYRCNLCGVDHLIVNGCVEHTVFSERRTNVRCGRCTYLWDDPIHDLENEKSHAFAEPVASPTPSSETPLGDVCLHGPADSCDSDCAEQEADAIARYNRESSETPQEETIGHFLHRIADFIEAHGRDEGGFSDATRQAFSEDAAHLREITVRAPQPEPPFHAGDRVIVTLSNKAPIAGVVTPRCSTCGNALSASPLGMVCLTDGCGVQSVSDLPDVAAPGSPDAVNWGRVLANPRRLDDESFDALAKLIPALLSDRDSLRSEIAALREDKARLDWLDRCVAPASVYGETLDGYGWSVEGLYPSVRVALDAARSSSSEPTQ